METGTGSLSDTPRQFGSNYSDGTIQTGTNQPNQQNKRPAQNDGVHEDETDVSRLIRVMMEGQAAEREANQRKDARMEAMLAAQQQANELQAEKLTELQQQIVSLRSARAPASPTAPTAGDGDAGARPPAATSDGPEPPHSAPIEKFISEAKTLMSKTLNRFNASKVTCDAFAEIDAGENFLDLKLNLDKTLPKKIKEIKAVQLTLPTEMKEDAAMQAKLDAAQAKVDEAHRRLQLATFVQMKTLKHEERVFYGTQLTKVGTDLTKKIVDLLADTSINNALKTQLLNHAMEKYEKLKADETVKIETTRVERLRVREEQQKELDVARLRQLETNNETSIISLIHNEIDAKAALGDADQMQLGDKARRELLESNEAKQKQVLGAVNPNSGNGRSKNGRAAGAQKTQHQKQKQTPKPKGNKKDQGKSKNKSGGTRKGN
jgi:hypothetical protein